MVDVKTEIEINVPIEKVRTYTANPENATKWYVNIKSVERLHSDDEIPEPFAIGSKMAFKADFLGKELAYVYEIVELSDEKMIMKTSDGPFPMQTTYIWESISDDKTKMILRNNGYPSGFSRFFSFVMVSAMKRANKKDLALLKKILEGSSGNS